MSILVRQAIIKDINSPHNNKVKDIHIDNGVILAIDDQLNVSAGNIIDVPGLHVSPGWVDMFVNGTDPGYEFKDTLETTAAAAASGGFTHVFLTPNTKPVVETKTAIDYIIRSVVSSAVQLHPIGAVTKHAEGKELAEMHEMKNSGAIAFGDGSRAVQSAGLLIKALQYINAFDGVLIQLPDDHSIAPHGLMNEGLVSTRIGLPGKPALAEELMIMRDLALARYTDSRLHITGITLASSVDLIRKAKADGLPVTCSTTPHHLVFTEEDLMKGYDTNLKLNPPLRTEKDRQALIAGLQDGTIDCITSHHTAQHKDAKVCEFEYAGYGTLGLETVFGVLNAIGLDIDLILQKICYNPRQIFGLGAVIRENERADLTLFIPDSESWHIGDKSLSNSANNAFSSFSLKGKVTGTILSHQSSIKS